MDRICSSLSLIFFVLCFVATSALPRLALKEEETITEKLDAKTLELVDKQLLALFGLKKKVQPRKHLSVPEFILNAYKKWNGDVHDDTDPMTNTIRALHHVDNHVLHGKKSMFFNMKNFPKTETVRKAELHVYREPKEPMQSQVSAALHKHVKSHSRSRRSLVESRSIDTSSPGWEVFNVTSVVEEWIRDPSMQHKLSIFLTGDTAKESTEILHLNRLFQNTSLVEWEKKRPVLIIQTNDGNKRHRRAVRTPSKQRSSNRHSSKHRARKLHEKAKLEMCRRRNFYLDFQRIGWSTQIISPVGFDMYYCKGSCPKPLGAHMNTTNHAVIQNQVNSFDPTLVPPPCCVPSTLGGESFLYIDMDSQIVMKTYPNIVVHGCGCR
eukprot:gene20187-22162_t